MPTAKQQGQHQVLKANRLVTLGGKQALRLAQAVTKETVLEAEKRVDMVLKLEAKVDME